MSKKIIKNLNVRCKGIYSYKGENNTSVIKCPLRDKCTRYGIKIESDQVFFTWDTFIPTDISINSGYCDYYLDIRR